MSNWFSAPRETIKSAPVIFKPISLFTSPELEDNNDPSGERLSLPPARHLVNSDGALFRSSSYLESLQSYQSSSDAFSDVSPGRSSQSMIHHDNRHSDNLLLSQKANSFQQSSPPLVSPPNIPPAISLESPQHPKSIVQSQSNGPYLVTQPDSRHSHMQYSQISHQPILHSHALDAINGHMVPPYGQVSPGSYGYSAPTHLMHPGLISPMSMMAGNTQYVSPSSLMSVPVTPQNIHPQFIVPQNMQHAMLNTANYPVPTGYSPSVTEKGIPTVTTLPVGPSGMTNIIFPLGSGYSDGGFVDPNVSTSHMNNRRYSRRYSNPLSTGTSSPASNSVSNTAHSPQTYQSGLYPTVSGFGFHPGSHPRDLVPRGDRYEFVSSRKGKQEALERLDNHEIPDRLDPKDHRQRDRFSVSERGENGFVSSSQNEGNKNARNRVSNRRRGLEAPLIATVPSLFESLSLLKDQPGCRQLQNILDIRSEETERLSNILAHISSLLAFNSFANYVVQRMIAIDVTGTTVPIIANALYIGIDAISESLSSISPTVKQEVLEHPVIQQLFESVRDHQKSILRQHDLPLDIPQVLLLSLDMHATRVLQKLLEYPYSPNSCELLMKEMFRMGPYIPLVACDHNANHVLTCLITLAMKDLGIHHSGNNQSNSPVKTNNGNSVPPSSVPRPYSEVNTTSNAVSLLKDVILPSLASSIMILAKHRYGAVVVQRAAQLGDSCGSLLLEAVLQNAAELVFDGSGNFVVSHLISYAPSHYVKHLLHSLKGRWCSMALHKCASNVVERAIEKSEASLCSAIILELLGRIESASDIPITSSVSSEPLNAAQNKPNKVGDGVFVDLLHSPFGNFVVQQAVVSAPEYELSLIIETLRPHFAIIAETPGGKRIVSKLIARVPSLQQELSS